MLSFPAGAMRRYDVVGRQLAKGGDRRFYDRVEGGAGQMEPAEKRVQPIDAGEPHGASRYVHRAGVAAAG